MHQTRKGNEWHFGMKIHIGVDADTGLVHTVTTTAANAHDVTEAHRLLHGGETTVWCDAGYQGVHKREENLGREVGQALLYYKLLNGCWSCSTPRNRSPSPVWWNSKAWSILSRGPHLAQVRRRRM